MRKSRNVQDGPYHWLSYGQVLVKIQNFGSGLLKMGLNGPFPMVGVFAKNCPEWFITEHAIYNYSMVLVPIYDSLSEESKQFVVNQSESKVPSIIL